MRTYVEMEVHHRAFLVAVALAGSEWLPIYNGQIFSFYQLDRMLGGPQSRSRRGGVEIIDVAAGYGALDIRIATGLWPTELPQLPKEMKFCGMFLLLL